MWRPCPSRDLLCDCKIFTNFCLTFVWSSISETSCIVSSHTRSSAGSIRLALYVCFILVNCLVHIISVGSTKKESNLSSDFIFIYLKYISDGTWYKSNQDTQRFTFSNDSQSWVAENGYFPSTEKILWWFVSCAGWGHCHQLPAAYSACSATLAPGAARASTTQDHT